MPVPPLRLDDDAPALQAGLDRIRAEFEVPGPHSAEAAAEADAAAHRVLGGLDATAGGLRRDVRDIAFVTIDPPGSRDLDQALHIERHRSGWRVRYAIADVPAFVIRGGPLDAELPDRGVTFYLPDCRSPLHPRVLGEDAASLVPGQDRPALLWTIDVDADGSVASAHLERAIVRSRSQLTYAEVQTSVDSGWSGETLPLLAEVGQVRQELEAARDGVSLDLPVQRVVCDGDVYRLEREVTLPAMGWNAQISLLAGMVAADAMLRAGVGLLRTMPPPDQKVVKVVRRAAKALGVPWPDGASYASVVRGLDGSDPAQAAVLALAAHGLRGAGYLALGTGKPTPGDPDALRHGAVAAPYAHVTAPLRRLADRAALEVCLALHAGELVPGAVVAALADLPAIMARAGSRERGAAKAAIDLVEALVLAPRVGEVLQATVVAADEDGSTVVVESLVVQADIEGTTLPLGESVTVRVDAADPMARRVHLTPV